MIDSRLLTLIQLGIVALGALAYWLWPRFAGLIVLLVFDLCFAAMAVAEPDNWRAYVEPPLFMSALLFVIWIWNRVRDARRR